ncbi:MAG: DUF2059 domain-containing protein [Pseudomonadota bacterium]
MLRHAIALSACLSLAPLTALASPRIDALLNAVGMERMLELMREEGLVYGDDLALDFLGGSGGSSWEAAVSAVYDTDRMRETLKSGFADSFDEDMLTPLEEFYGSETGVEIVALEIAAREAFLDRDLEDATKAQIPELQASNPEAFDQVTAFIEINDLVDQNVVGALNSNYAFYIGLMEGGGFPSDLSESDILADVWGQEGEIRENTTEWLYAFLLTAYLPLEAQRMEAYLDLSRSEAGQAFTRALFAGFDEMFIEVSRGLGAAASRFMASEEL